MRFVSFFTGIGGFDLGFEQAGMECVFQVEKDKFCNKLLEVRWPGIKRMEDINDVKAEELPATDAFCGGFPCQDLSVAGKRKGLGGERSSLWFQFLKIIEQSKPRFIVVENVPGLLSSHKGRDFAILLRGLADCGYYAAWRVLDSQYFGVPQRRRRVFIVASLGNASCAEILFESESGAWNPAPSREAGGKVAGTIGAQLEKRSSAIDGNGAFVPFGINGSDVGYTLRKNPSRSGDKGDGGLNTTLVGKVAGTLHNGTPGRDASDIADNKLITFAPQAGGRPHSRLIAFQQNTRDEVRLMNGDGQIAGALAAQPGMKQQNYIAATVQSGGNNGGFRTEPGEHLVTCFTPWDAQTKRIHNPAHPAPTLAGSDGGGGQRFPNFATQTGVRRLTPLECERLQGFPDGWTDVGNSDTQRYRQLGNAVTVSVAYWLAKRILKYGEIT